MSKPIRRLKLAGADVKVFKDSAGACEAAIDKLLTAIPVCVDFRGKAVLGLATGATPEPIYARLVEAYQSEMLSFRDVSTYNLDEYYPMDPLDPRSYHSYMDRHLFGRVDIDPERIHLLDGTVPKANITEHAAQFDRRIRAEGGIDVQLLGLGRNGHIGFNEPTNLPVQEALTLQTRLVELHPITVEDAAKDFGGEANVPRQALTMGVASILGARSILVLAFGERKAPAVARSLKESITAEVPGSLLQAAPGQVTWLLDKAAASEIL